ncbi:MAG: hypothetical protein AAF333_04780 [Planctomycetota bacterium]
MYVFRFTLALALMPALLLGCSSETQPSAPEGDSSNNTWRLEEAPADPMNVAEAKAAAVPGESIIVVGKIGGRLDPITPESGLFIIMDTSIASCDELPGDNCATPWDYCCETPGDIAANAATVQLRDEAGQPISLGEEDLSPLDRVVVVGTIAPGATDESLIIHATGLVTP